MQGFFVVCEYDANNNLAKVDEGNGSDKYISEYVYDADNRETATKVGNYTYSTTYDALGRINALSWNTTNSYDTTMIYHPGADGSQSLLLKSIDNDGSMISYTYDANGNIASITDSAGTSKYYYDEMNQMYSEDNHITNETVVYLYDAACNILSKKIYPFTNEETISGTPTDTIIYSYAGSWADQFSYDGTTITYDVLGNPTLYLGKTMTWNRGWQLSSISDNTINYSYTYNPDGLRVGKKNNATGETTSYQI